MGLAYNVYLNADKIFGCKNCKTHLASHDAIISRVSSLPPSPFPPETLPTSISPPNLHPSLNRNPLTCLELPRPTRQSLPLQRRSQHLASRGCGA